jgi:hemolysin activation/secretion protein
MNARILSIAAAVALSVASAAAIAQPAQDNQQAQQASEQAAPAKHHRLFNAINVHLPRVTQSHNDSLYRNH